MTVVSKEVKTIARIHIDKEEFKSLVRFYLNNPEGFEAQLYPKAFIKLKDDTDDSIFTFSMTGVFHQTVTPITL